MWNADVSLRPHASCLMPHALGDSAAAVGVRYKGGLAEVSVGEVSITKWLPPIGEKAKLRWGLMEQAEKLNNRITE